MPRAREWNSQPRILVNLEKDVNQKLADFRKMVDDEHISWLKEVVNEAKKAFNKDAYQLLPKTPCMKRKRGKNGQSEGLDTISSGESSLFTDPASSDASPVLGNADHASTFLDNRCANNQKKLRIDISEICQSTTLDVSEASKREPRKEVREKSQQPKTRW